MASVEKASAVSTDEMSAAPTVETGAVSAEDINAASKIALNLDEEVCLMCRPLASGHRAAPCWPRQSARLGRRMESEAGRSVQARLVQRTRTPQSHMACRDA